MCIVGVDPTFECLLTMTMPSWPSAVLLGRGASQRPTLGHSEIVERRVYANMANLYGKLQPSGCKLGKYRG